MCKIILVCCFLVSYSCDIIIAQTLPPPSDSARVYRKIEDFSKKRKVTRYMYGLLFKPVAPQKAATKGIADQKQVKPAANYRTYEGKIIRKINITTYDPFGYSLTDTTSRERNILYTAGNKLHMKTQRMTIKNLLLIHKNDALDSLLVRESERLIRSQRYVHEVGLTVIPVAVYSDSVDINIQVIDVWSIDGGIGASTTHATFDLNERNFLGLGHEFKNTYTLNHTNGANAYSSNYYISNIENTYINTTLHYNIDENKFYNKAISFDRPFYSPVTKWAAGISLSQQCRQDMVKETNNLYIKENIKYNSGDYWLARSNRVSFGNTVDDRVTKLIIAGRYFRNHFVDKPILIYDSLHSYPEERFYLISAGLSTRNYFRDRYIFNYGVIEDVPIGKLYNVVAGYQVKDNVPRLYLGGQIGWGEFNWLGYFSTNLEYGTFLRADHAEQGVFNAGVSYFTNLLEIGRWKFRQFIKPQLTVGINRLPQDNITINNENGIRGFSSTLTGTKKFVLTLQTQSYAPWNILGFQFGPYFIYSAAVMGNESTRFDQNHVYSQFGIGLLIKNEFLVFTIFQVSVAFYPAIPNDGTNVFKYNPDKTSDIGFRDFIIGKPSPITYQ